MVSYIHNFEWLFIKEKQNASIEEQKAQIVKDKKQLTQYQQIDIYYSGVGIISVSTNEYNFEKEFQNILKSNRKTA